MLGKLLKYEFKSTARILIPLYIFAIIFSGICRLFQTISDNFKIMTTPTVLMYIFYVVIMIAIVVTTFIIMIQRFYKNLIGDEGYLMFTLPVEPHQHILTKFITSFTWLAASLVVAVISIFILIFTPKLFDEIRQILSMTPKEMIPSIIYSILFSIFAAISGILMIYAAMAIGQLVTGHRIIGSVVAYFGMYVINQIIMTIGLAVYGYVNKNTLFQNSVSITDIASVFVIALVYDVIICCVYFLATHYIFKNKLNLE